MNANENQTNQAPEQAKKANQPEGMNGERAKALRLKGVKVAEGFLGAELKLGNTKRELLSKAYADIKSDDELTEFLEGFAEGFKAKGQSDNTVAVRKSEAKMIYKASRKNPEAFKNLGGEWNNFVTECRKLVAEVPAANKPVDNKAQDGKGVEPEKKDRKSRKVSAAQVDKIADKATELNQTQNFQVISANIEAMAEKPGFEVALMQTAHGALLQIEESTQDEFWKKRVTPLITEIAKILADAKKAAADAVALSHGVKESSKNPQEPAEALAANPQ